MSPPPTKEQVLNDILLSLADQFESGSTQWRWFKPESPQEFEPLRECLADMISEGWLDRFDSFNAYKLTPAGYKHFRRQIKALRVLGKSS